MIRLVRSATTAAAAAVLAASLAACGAITPPSPTPTLMADFTVSLPIPTTDKAVVEAAVDVLSKRLRALGIGLFSAGAGTSLTFTIPFDGTVDKGTIEAVLRSPGAVKVIGWEADDGDVPQAGDPAPTGGTALFDATTQIASATVVPATDPGTTPSIELALGPDGAAALATWTKAHVGENLVIVIDGNVLESPVVMSDIPDGHVALTFPTVSAVRPEVVAAILASGPLPARWIAP